MGIFYKGIGYGLDDRGLILTRGRDFSSLRHRVQSGSGAHPASSPVGTRGSIPECKAAGV